MCIYYSSKCIQFYLFHLNPVTFGASIGNSEGPILFRKKNCNALGILVLCQKCAKVALHNIPKYRKNIHNYFSIPLITRKLTGRFLPCWYQFVEGRIIYHISEIQVIRVITFRVVHLRNRKIRKITQNKYFLLMSVFSLFTLCMLWCR